MSGALARTKMGPTYDVRATDAKPLSNPKLVLKFHVFAYQMMWSHNATSPNRSLTQKCVRGTPAHKNGTVIRWARYRRKQCREAMAVAWQRFPSSGPTFEKETHETCDNASQRSFVMHFFKANLENRFSPLLSSMRQLALRSKNDLECLLTFS